MVCSSRPKMAMAPAVGWSRPAIRLSNVDLPEPEVPSRQANSPRGTCSETPARARTRFWPILYSRTRSVADIASAAIGAAWAATLETEDEDMLGAWYYGRREGVVSRRRQDLFAAI